MTRGVRHRTSRGAGTVPRGRAPPVPLGVLTVSGARDTAGTAPDPPGTGSGGRRAAGRSLSSFPSSGAALAVRPGAPCTAGCGVSGGVMVMTRPYPVIRLR